jgi:hypothetical protein
MASPSRSGSVARIRPCRPLQGLGDVGQALGRLGVDLPAHREVVVGLHRAVLRRQVADVAVGGQDRIVRAQVLVDGLGLGRALDDDDVHAAPSRSSQPAPAVVATGQPVRRGLPDALPVGWRQSPDAAQAAGRPAAAAARVRLDLDGLDDADDLTAPIPPPRPRARDRRPLLLIGGAVGVIALVTVAALALSRRQAEPVAPAPEVTVAPVAPPAAETPPAETVAADVDTAPLAVEIAPQPAPPAVPPPSRTTTTVALTPPRDPDASHSACRAGHAAGPGADPGRHQTRAPGRRAAAAGDRGAGPASRPAAGGPSTGRP